MGENIREMVLMEKALSFSSRREGEVKSFRTQGERIIKALRSYSKWANELNNYVNNQLQLQFTSINSKIKYVLREQKEEAELYNMEPFASSPIYVDMGIELYDLEADF
jgi:hypothetical protein